MIRLRPLLKAGSGEETFCRITTAKFDPLARPPPKKIINPPSAQCLRRGSSHFEYRQLLGGTVDHWLPINYHLSVVQREPSPQDLSFLLATIGETHQKNT